MLTYLILYSCCQVFVIVCTCKPVNNFFGWVCCLQADEFKAKGNAALQAGKAEEAVAFYTQGIEVDASNHVLFSNRSAAYAKLENYAEALNDAEKTVSLKPDWPKVRTAL